jgi:hypothetical protein
VEHTNVLVKRFQLVLTSHLAPEALNRTDFLFAHMSLIDSWSSWVFKLYQDISRESRCFYFDLVWDLLWGFAASIDFHKNCNHYDSVGHFMLCQKCPRNWDWLNFREDNASENKFISSQSLMVTFDHRACMGRHTVMWVNVCHVVNSGDSAICTSSELIQYSVSIRIRKRHICRGWHSSMPEMNS